MLIYEVHIFTTTLQRMSSSNEITWYSKKVYEVIKDIYLMELSIYNGVYSLKKLFTNRGIRVFGAREGHDGN